MGYHFLFYVFAFAKANPRPSQLEGRPGGKVHSDLKQEQGQLPAVSVIICAKNEAENLKKHLPLLLQQDYPNFEIVLINDASYDQTKAVMESFATTDARVKQVNVENIEAFWGSKKYALTLGIKAATHERLLFIDADCYPKSAHWIQYMVSCASPNTAVVLGYGGYQKRKHSWLNSLIRYETVYTAMQYFSYALAGNPYMGVGRNLMYTKTLFFEQRGFINHMKIPSGDDDLFVNEAATSNNTKVCYHPDAHTVSPAKSTFKSWVIQKRRHISVAHYYKLKDRLLLGGFFLSQLGFFVLALVLVSSSFMVNWVLLLIALRYLIAWIAIGKSAAKLKEIDVAYLFPLHELFLILFQLGIFSANLISKPKRWK